MCVYEKFRFDSRFDKRRMRGLKTDVFVGKINDRATDFDTRPDFLSKYIPVKFHWTSILH